jgi:hypothetical protein
MYSRLGSPITVDSDNWLDESNETNNAETTTACTPTARGTPEATTTALTGRPIRRAGGLPHRFLGLAHVE